MGVRLLLFCALPAILVHRHASLLDSIFQEASASSLLLMAWLIAIFVLRGKSMGDALRNLISRAYKLGPRNLIFLAGFSLLKLLPLAKEKIEKETAKHVNEMRNDLLGPTASTKKTLRIPKVS